MSRNKLSKFADMATYPHVFQPGLPEDRSKDGLNVKSGNTEDGFKLKGRWGADFFHSNNPIVLELGCGRGEYTVGLALRFPDKNFIGIDIKGARMWTGATESLELGLKNVAFLRTRIEFIEKFFATDEVSELWLTFSDPQMKKPTKRLTSTFFLERYRKFMTNGGTIHVKTDSNFLFTYTNYVLQHNGITPLMHTTDLYSEETVQQFANSEMRESMLPLLQIKTYYEQQWLDRGIPIKYISFCLPHSTPLSEPEVEIELDTYRSYARSKRSSLIKAK